MAGSTKIRQCPHCLAQVIVLSGSQCPACLEDTAKPRSGAKQPVKLRPDDQLPTTCLFCGMATTRFRRFKHWVTNQAPAVEYPNHTQGLGGLLFTLFAGIGGILVGWIFLPIGIIASLFRRPQPGKSGGVGQRCVQIRIPHCEGCRAEELRVLDCDESNTLTVAAHGDFAQALAWTRSA